MKNRWITFAHHGLLMLNQAGEDASGGAPAADGASVEDVDAGDGTQEADEHIEGEEALADKGKKALDAMKAARNQARREAAEAKAELERLKAEVEGRKEQFEAEQRAREIEAQALAKANERILRAEVRALAAGKLADPNDALLYIDLTEFEVGDDGSVDQSAIAEAIAGLIAQKPYLAAQGGARFNGSADQGVRNAASKSQLTEADLESMTDEQIQKAKQEGRLDALLGRIK